MRSRVLAMRLKPTRRDIITNEMPKMSSTSTHKNHTDAKNGAQ